MADPDEQRPKRSGGLRQLAADLDRLLRGGFTDEDALRAGRIEVPVRTLTFSCLALGGFYGVMMALYTVSHRGTDTAQQLLSGAVKVPLLFLLTLAVTFPSLYVFSALARSSLRVVDTLRLLLAAIAVNLALLASLGPVTAFFTFSTTSYHFMIVLNVAFFGVSGLVGLGFIRQALIAALGTPEPVQVTEEGEGDPTPAPKLRARARQGGVAVRVFSVWLVVYAVVGAQMGWILRPFIGSPDLPFEWFRARESNFFEAFFRSLGDLFS